jgi:hypothetical protein
MNACEQSKRILRSLGFREVAVHQKQVRLRRFSQAPAEFLGLGKQAHAETFRQNPMNIIQDAWIGVQDCDLRLAAVLCLYWPFLSRAYHLSFPHTCQNNLS